MTVITHDLRKTLTSKEAEIYKLMCENCSNKQISKAIDMPYATVQWHVRNIFQKLGIQAEDSSDKQGARRRAILYSGTRIEQVIDYTDKSERAYTIKDIRTAAKKTGFSLREIEDLVSFLEMDND